jgi:hypothetical protein
MVRVSKKKGDAPTPAPAPDTLSEPVEEHVPCVLIAVAWASNLTDSSNAVKRAVADVIINLLRIRMGATCEDSGPITFIRIPDVEGDFARSKREVLNRVDIYNCHSGDGARKVAERLDQVLGDKDLSGVLGWRTLTGQLDEMFLRYGITKVFS